MKKRTIAEVPFGVESEKPVKKSKGKNKSPRVRYWVVVINNPDGDLEPEKIKDLQYAIWCPERGDEGTRHLQCYLQFKNAIEMMQAKKRIGFGKAHLEPASGTPEQNVQYVKKEGPYSDKKHTHIGDVQEWGVLSIPGKRNDCQKAIELLEQKVQPHEIVRMIPTTLRLINCMDTFLARSIKPRPDDQKTEVIVVFGRSRLGKTTWVKQTEKSLYKKPNTTKWWPFYNGEDAVVVDDPEGLVPFDGWSGMLDIWDKGAAKIEVKGGFVYFNSKRIYLTCNVLPHIWVKDEFRDHEAFYNRIDKILHFYELGVYDEHFIGNKANYLKAVKSITQRVKSLGNTSWYNGQNLDA